MTSLKSAGSANVPLRGGLRNLRVERLEWPGCRYRANPGEDVGCDLSRGFDGILKSNKQEKLWKTMGKL